MVDGERVPAVGHLDDFGHALVVLLLLVGGVGDRRRHGVVPLAGDDQQRTTAGVGGVDLGLGPGVEIGSGSTPRNGAGSIATDTAARPRPARIWVSSPLKECLMIAGLRSSPRMIVSKWSATWPIDLPANTSGWALACSTVSGSSGHPGVSAT